MFLLQEGVGIHGMGHSGASAVRSIIAGTNPKSSTISWNNFQIICIIWVSKNRVCTNNRKFVCTLNNHNVHFVHFVQQWNHSSVYFTSCYQVNYITMVTVTMVTVTMVTVTMVTVTMVTVTVVTVTMVTVTMVAPIPALFPARSQGRHCWLSKSETTQAKTCPANELQYSNKGQKGTNETPTMKNVVRNCC